MKETIKGISALLENSPVTDIIADAILMLIDWTEGAKLKMDLKEDVNVMFDSFIANIDDSLSDAIVNYDYCIIGKLVKAWHPVLDPPKCLNEKWDKGVRLIFSLLENGLGPKLAEYDGILRYLLMFLERWKEKEEDILRITSAIGLFLKFSALDPSYQVTEAATNDISCVLRKMQEPNRLIKYVLRHVHGIPRAVVNILWICGPKSFSNLRRNKSEEYGDVPADDSKVERRSGERPSAKHWITWFIKE